MFTSNWSFTMLETIFFAAGTAWLLYVSKDSLRVPRSHGFYRFFAWELMLVLIVLNMNGWYDAPMTIDQIICGMLMSASLLLAVLGYQSLRLFGRQDDNRNDGPLLVFEKTTVLVTQGIFRYIRHPMYSSLILLDGGLFMKKMSWTSGGIALVAFVLLLFATLAEEMENTRYFGAQYQEYMKRSKRFVPFLY